MFTLEYAKDPFYNSDDGQQIHLTVKFAEFNEELPFNATSFDGEAHGRDLYARAKAGEFGEVQKYAPPKQPAENQPNADGLQTL